MTIAVSQTGYRDHHREVAASLFSLYFSSVLGLERRTDLFLRKIGYFCVFMAAKFWRLAVEY
jgi:hypothetical protein